MVLSDFCKENVLNSCYIVQYSAGYVSTFTMTVQNGKKKSLALKTTENVMEGKYKWAMCQKRERVTNVVSEITLKACWNIYTKFTVLIYVTHSLLCNHHHRLLSRTFVSSHIETGDLKRDLPHSRLTIPLSVSMNWTILSTV